MMFCRRNRNALLVSVAAALSIIAGAADRADSQESPTAATAPAQDPEVRMGHISIRATGRGSPVILIPGMSSPREVWSGVTPDIAANHRVYLVQVNGFAGGDPGDNLEPGVLDGIVDDLAAFIAENDLESPAVVGHSMGGLVGMMLAARHPDSVGRLMVVDAMPFFGAVMGAASPEAIEPRASGMRDQLIASYAPAGGEAVTSDPGGIWSITPEGRIQVANWARMADMRVVAHALYEDMVTDIGPELDAVTARPFIALYAAGMGAAQARAVWEPQYAGTPATLVAIPDSYHFIMLDQRDRFLEEIAAFLAD